MGEVYDLHRHTHCVIFHLRETGIRVGCHYNLDKDIRDATFSMKRSFYIAYDKQRSNVLNWGYDGVNEIEDTIPVYLSAKRLYGLFEKKKNMWDHNDQFLFTAASDFIRLTVEEYIQDKKEAIKDTDALHYVCIVPSEWEEESREVLVRPIFVKANLISKEDHRDRLLFCSDVESIFYFLTDPNTRYNFTMTRNVILGRIVTVEKNEVLIKLDLVSTGIPLFEFPGSVMFPKIVNSNSISLTSNRIKDSIRDFIKTRFSFDAQEETIRNIMEELNSHTFNYVQEKDEVAYLTRPFIADKSISELDKRQKKFIQSIRLFNICAEISKNLSNNIQDLIQQKLVKEYSVLNFTEKNSGITADKSLLNWSTFLFAYNRVSLGSKYILPQLFLPKYISGQNFLSGAGRYLIDVVRNSNAYSKPRILAKTDSATSSSIFIKSKPDAIMNIDISFESTMLSFSLLHENGLVKNIWSHKYFVPGIHLRSLGSFFSFSEVATLNVKYSFITFVEEYLTEGSMVFSDDIYDILNKNMMVKIEDILNVESNNKDRLISTQQQVYIRKFVLIYLIHIDEIVTRKLQVITGNNDDMKIGYDITVEKMLLKKLSVTEDDLRDMMYGISFVRKDDSCTKLRITTQGERLLPLIQKSLNLQFPLRSCFLVAQLYEDYVQLSVNEVVTESGEKRKDQESIIIQEKLIPTPNIYKSLCLNAWNNIIEDTSRIQLCDTHKGYNNSELLEIFSLVNRAKFTSNLEEFISEKILKKNLTAQETDTTTTINISTSCDCRVCLTLNDITEISFRPVLQDIISLVSTSLINKQLFGKYRNIRYMFHLIRFNYNSQFQHILMKILNDETDYFLYEQRIEIARYTIPILSNQLWRPIREREPCSYKAFQEGVLYHVHSENYGFGFFSYNVKGYSFKNKISDSKSTSLDNKTVFPLFKKGSKINNSRTDRVFYLNSENYRDFSLNIKLYRLKMTYTLTLDKKVLLKDTLEKMNGPNVEGKAFRRRLNIPFIISVAYKGYLSSLSLVVRSGGDGIQESNCTVLAEPMTLARF